MKMQPLWNGMRMKLEILTGQGDIASRERLRDESYFLEARLQIQVPRPLTTMDDLSASCPGLPRVLPGLPQLLASAKESPYYHSLYQRKVIYTEQRATLFNQLLSRHNFFDCETILEATAGTGRKVLLVQAEMDVVTDGSDPDRALTYDRSSSTFQPWTAYSWNRKSLSPASPFIAEREAEIAKLKGVQALAAATEQQKKDAAWRTTLLKKEIEALTYRSSLVAAIDPFIVLPIFMFEDVDRPFAPRIGDFAIVVHGERAFPAIVGDKGPNSKIGEASTLICNTINPSSDGKRRAVSDLVATYLVFPGTAEPAMATPDHARWRDRCLALAKEIGGLGVPLHDWRPIPAAPQPPAAAPLTGGAK